MREKKGGRCSGGQRVVARRDIAEEPWAKRPAYARLDPVDICMAYDTARYETGIIFLF